MKVLFFAQARQTTGQDQYTLSVQRSLTEQELWALLVDTFPALAALQKTSRLARNESYLQDGEPIQPDDEIAVIPPVSGG